MNDTSGCSFLLFVLFNFQGRSGLFINNYIGHLHLLLLTKHSLFSEVCGHGLPIGEGFCRTLLVLVSSPHLKPQVFPKREQGLHSLHSPTSQCTKTVNKSVKPHNTRIQHCRGYDSRCTVCQRLTCWDALHWVIGLKIVWADVMTLPMQEVVSRHTPRTRVTVLTGVTVHRTCCKTITHTHITFTFIIIGEKLTKCSKTTNWTIFL